MSCKRYIIGSIMTEEMSLEDRNKTYYTYCNTETVSKNYTFVWHINDLCNMMKFISNLKLNTDEEQLPFNIFLKADDVKLIFYVKATPEIKAILCDVRLQSGVSKNKFHNLPCLYDGEKYCFEIDISFLVGQGLEFIFCDSLRIIFNLRCIKSISHYTINTKALHYNNKMDIKDLPDSTCFITATLNAQNANFRVSKKMLCAKSEYFRNWFSTNKNTTIDMKNLSADVVLMFTDFIDHNDISRIKNVDIYDVLVLLKMSSTYNIKDLQTICERRVKHSILMERSTLDEEILLDILVFAHRYRIKDLLKLIIDYVVLNMDYIDNTFYLNMLKKFPSIFTLLNEATISTHEAQGVFG